MCDLKKSNGADTEATAPALKGRKEGRTDGACHHVVQETQGKQFEFYSLGSG